MSYRLIDNETNEDIIDKLGRIKDERDKYKKVLDKIKEYCMKNPCYHTNTINELLEEIE